MKIQFKIVVLFFCMIAFGAGALTASMYGLMLPIETISFENLASKEITSIKLSYTSLDRTLFIEAPIPALNKTSSVKFLAEGNGTCFVKVSFGNARSLNASCGAMVNFGTKTFRITDSAIAVIK